MKVPKYILRIAGTSFVVPSDSGIATLIKMLEDAVPVQVDRNEITLSYSDEEPEHYQSMVEYLREVKIRKIPANAIWKRKTKAGGIEIVQVVEKKPKAIKGPSLKALPGPKRAALPPRNPQLALL